MNKKVNLNLKKSAGFQIMRRLNGGGGGGGRKFVVGEFIAKKRVLWPQSRITDPDLIAEITLLM
jgi:hypothetical protein